MFPDDYKELQLGLWAEGPIYLIEVVGRETMLARLPPHLLTDLVFLDLTISY